MAGQKQYPMTGEAQEIGQEAKTCLYVRKPVGWILTDRGGSEDYGFDMEVQVSVNQEVTDAFRIQLKGTRAPDLNADGTFFSIELKKTTLNYYDNIVEPILLVLCDLSIDPENSCNCPAYYVWIRPELKRIDIKNIPTEQEKVTLRVPKSNVLTKSDNLINDIRRANALSNVGHLFDSHLESVRPSMGLDARVTYVSTLSTGLIKRGLDFCDAVAQQPTSHWVEPIKGTISSHLTEVSKFIRAGRTGECAKKFEMIEKMLSNATPLEMAEYYFQFGKSKALEGLKFDALNAFKQAANIGQLSKYWVAWGEMELVARYQIDASNDFSQTIAQLKGNDPEIISIKARLLAASDKYQEAKEILKSISGVDYLIGTAIVETMYWNFEGTLSVSSEGLALPDLSDSQRQLLLLLKVRSRFYLAIGEENIDGRLIPPAGLPSINIEIIKETWIDLQELIENLEQSGWPSNTDIIADIWLCTASMLGKQQETLQKILSAAKARPHLEALQYSAENIAAQCGDLESALLINGQIADGNLKLCHRIAILHDMSRHRDCVNLTKKSLSELDRKNHLFGETLVCAALSANTLAENSFANHILGILGSDESLLHYESILRFYITLNTHHLKRDLAIQELEKKYEDLKHPVRVALVLLQYLDAGVPDQAHKCVAISRDIQTVIRLSERDLSHICLAMVTLESWEELLILCKTYRPQFSRNEKLKAFHSLALDRLGDTDAARIMLSDMIDRGVSDQIALNTYVNIMVRCGFATEALEAAEKIFERSQNSAQKIDSLRLMFGLIETSTPGSYRLVEITDRLADIVNQIDELEEGTFIALRLEAFLNGDHPETAEQTDAFQARILAYKERFPDSKIFRTIDTSNIEKSPEEFVAAVKKLSGYSEERYKAQLKMENQLQRGLTPIPYAWRPRYVFGNIRDIFHLWEVTKRSSPDDKKYHFAMVDEKWEPTLFQQKEDEIPLIDLLTLTIIFDLEMIDLLFVYFEKVAITQRTFIELARLTHTIHGSCYRHKCVALQDSLKIHLSQIVQPLAVLEDGNGIDLCGLEIQHVFSCGGYLLYSDDIFFRRYCCKTNDNDNQFCTGDLIYALEQAGLLTTEEAAKKTALLCKWNVGLKISYEHQMSLLPEVLFKVKTVEMGVDVLMKDISFNSVAAAIWDIRSNFSESQNKISLILRRLLEQTNLSEIVIASYLATWLNKIKFRSDVMISLLDIISHTIILASAYHPLMSTQVSQRIWSVYLSLVEHVHGDRMDEKKEREGVAVLARACAEMDAKISLVADRSFEHRFGDGLINGTSNSDLFHQEYSNKMIQIKLQKSSN